ncbi:hypothetical protein JCM8547_001997 [Rhodosporidiobolus lusitaniae]
MVARTFSLVALIAALTAPLANASPTIGSPALYQCTVAAFTYYCDVTPCTVVIRPSDDATSQIDNLGSVDKTNGTVSWTPDVEEGTSVTAWITNSEGDTLSNAATTVNEGTTDCMDGSSSSSSTATSGSDSDSSASPSGSSTASSSASSSSSSADADSGASAMLAGGFLATALGVATLLV